MGMNSLRKGATGGLIKFVLFGLMILAVGGMVFMDVGGFFRDGGMAQSDVAKIGSERISIQQFDRMARRALQRVGMTPEQAQKMGYMREMLNGEVRTRLLAHKADSIGISIGIEPVVDKLHGLLAPMVRPGQEPTEVLAQLLQSQGMSEAELMHSISGEMAVGLLGNAIKSGFIETSDNMVNDLATFEKEQRSIEFISFPDKEFKDTKAPDETELKQMYEATKEAYANPELREGQLILVNTKNLKSTIEITDDELREAYDRDIASYSEPETRSVEAALLDTAEKAQKIAAAVKAGKSLKDATKDVTGNTTDYLPPKKFSEKEIDESLKAEVFNAKSGDMIGPVETALGHQVLVLKSINAPKVQSFNEIKAALRKDMEETKLADAQFEFANNLDDALASGTSTDDIKKQFDVEVITLAPMNTLGMDASGKPAFGEFKTIGDRILQNLFELNEGEASAIFEIPDGRMAAIALKSVTPKTYKPFEEVKETMLKQWTDTTRQADNKIATLKILADMDAEKLSMKDIAAKYKKQTQSVAGILRTKAPEAPLNGGSLGSIFEAKEGDIIALDVEGGAAIARVTKVNIEGTYSKEEMEKARPNIVNSLQNESYDIYLEQARKKFGAHINDELLAKVYETKEE